jgi:hypothetical protein
MLSTSRRLVVDYYLTCLFTNFLVSQDYYFTNDVNSPLSDIIPGFTMIWILIKLHNAGGFLTFSELNRGLTVVSNFYLNLFILEMEIFFEEMGRRKQFG